MRETYALGSLANSLEERFFQANLLALRPVAAQAIDLLVYLICRISLVDKGVGLMYW